MTTIPNTRHLDALVAQHVAKLPDVRLGWLVWNDIEWIAVPEIPDCLDGCPRRREYVYNARGASGAFDSGWEPVPRYSTDGNDMLGLVESQEKQMVYVSMDYLFGERRTQAVDYTTGRCGAGTAARIPESACRALANLVEERKRCDGDQHWEVRRELARLVDEARAAGVETEGQGQGVEHGRRE
jgi:hypothetical protein